MGLTILLAKRSNGMIDFSLYNPSIGRITKVDEVVSDIAYKNIPLNRLEYALKKATPRLVHLEDGTNKLYLQLGLLGGMMEEDSLELVRNLSITNQTVSNEAVADKILAAIPEKTYSSVTVYQVPYRFPGEQEEKFSRKIIIKPSDWAWFVNVIKVIFAAPQAINQNRAVKAILGSDDDADKQHLKKAFKKNYTYEIIVSFDEQNFYFEPITDWSTSKVETCLIL